MKILVIDDDDNFRGLLIALLKMDGHEPFGAEDGSSGIDLARKTNLDLILLDALMPGMDGFKTCETLKTDNDLNTIPVIMLTGLEKIKDAERAFEAGANEYITKPINEATFNDTLLRKLNQAKKTLK
jgi:DNA-binding response OmpR family regulator